MRAQCVPPRNVSLKLDEGAKYFSISQFYNCNYTQLCGDERCGPQIETKVVLQTLLENIK